ncbi:MAG: biosis protein MshG [Fimbriimonadaceae bacterium]|jgi:type II secretory pathway component PulF|nr:biosis protein MshG [Fimbriimonadaceae bacterium]
MPSFEFEATRENGERVSSVVFGRDMQDVMQVLGQQGLVVTRIQDAYAHNDPLRNAQPAYAAAGAAPTPPMETPRAADPAVAPQPLQQRSLPATGKRNAILTNLIGPLVLKPPLRELSFFFRQLGTMVEAGVPLMQSLDTLGKQSRDARLRHVVFEVRDAVDAGLPISAILQRYPETFSPLVVSLIRAGEEGGFLGAACKQVSEYLDHEIELRNTYKKEMFLPKMYVIASMGIIAGTNLLISSLGLRGGLNAPLNERETWYVLGPAIIAAFLFFKIGLSFYSVRKAWDGILLYVPYIGKTLHHFAMAKFGRAFGALYKGGVPVTRSIHLAADATGNEYIRSRIYPVVTKLENGEGIAQTLTDTGVFSPIVLNMMATGETTGSLDQMLMKVSEFYEDEGKVRAKQLANVVGVAVMVAVGFYIGYVVITFWTGYYGAVMNDAAGSGGM